VLDDDDDEPAPDPDEDDVDDEEPPHALTNAAIENRQAAVAANLWERMASLILGSPPRAAYSPALPSVRSGDQRTARRGC
jgi:hypothetical protein